MRYPTMHLHTEYVAFPARQDRSAFVARRFAEYLNGSVLDVGCYEAPLREILGSVSYTGIDVVGRPDIEVNLEKAERLPFEDSAFRCVLCIDVLEHLDNLHAVFAELVRVAQCHVIV
jgi:2-polyprenyl-3-methyl-5-hydroxy-6-metoxy-1,4-benzoquinol methylase